MLHCRQVIIARISLKPLQICLMITMALLCSVIFSWHLLFPAIKLLTAPMNQYSCGHIGKLSSITHSSYLPLSFISHHILCENPSDDISPLNPFPHSLTYLKPIFFPLYNLSINPHSISHHDCPPLPLFSILQGCSYNILKLINFSRPPFLMCFLKNIKTISQDPLAPSLHIKPIKSQSDTENHSSQEMLSNFESKSHLTPGLDSNYFLMNCLGLMNFNSQILKNLDQKLLSTEESLAASFSYLQDSTQENSQNGAKTKALFTQNIPQKVEQNLHQASNPLTQQLFGQQHYRYRLELAREFADVLYKERNFAIAVRLVEIPQGKEKRNGNLINLCVSVCDKEGEWINETKEGVAFIKGKVETELYHGQGEFCKLAPKDVSRAFPDKTVNLVVYCKPSLLKYSGETTLEENIDYRMIEPLIIKDISIKAKKRQ